MATGISPLDLEVCDLEVFDRMVEKLSKRPIGSRRGR